MRLIYPGWEAGKRGYHHAAPSSQPTTVVLDIDGALVDTDYQHAIAV